MNRLIRLATSSCLFFAAANVALAQDRLFVLDSSPQASATLLELDPGTGTPLSSFPITGHEALFGGLALDAAGDLYSIDGYNDPNSDRTFRIDKDTGMGTVVGNTTLNWNFRSVTIHPVTDVLYGWTDNRLYTLDKVTGAATLLFNVTGMNLDQGTALAINALGVGYLTDIGGNSLFRIDLATGATTFLGHLNLPSAWFGDLDFDSAGQLWGVHEGGDIYRIDIPTATATLAFSTVGYSGIAFLRSGGLGAAYCSPAVANSTGAPGRLELHGSAVAADNALSLEAEQLPPNSFGFFITSRTAGFVVGPGGSQGNLCLAGAIGRYVGAGQIQNSGAGGHFSYAPDLTLTPSPAGFVSVMAGDTWNFQAWHRDAIGGAATSNFTDAVALTFQ